MRNKVRFLLGNINDFDANKDSIELNNLLELDKWILTELKSLHLYFTVHYKTKSYHLVVQRIHNFCVNQLGGIYLDVIKDRQYTTQQDSEIRRSAQTAIKVIVDHLVVLISPILSFTAEEIWQTSASLSDKAQSVFLTSFEELEEFSSDLSPENWSRLLLI